MEGLLGDTSIIKRSHLIVGINNLFDQDPPFLLGPTADSICKCNTFAGGGYDFVGRSFYVKLSTDM